MKFFHFSFFHIPNEKQKAEWWSSRSKYDNWKLRINLSFRRIKSRKQTPTHTHTKQNDKQSEDPLLKMKSKTIQDPLKQEKNKTNFWKHQQQEEENQTLKNRRKQNEKEKFKKFKYWRSLLRIVCKS